MGIMRRWGQPWTRGDAYRVNHAHIQLVTPPLAEPVNINDFRRYARINFNTDDPLMGIMLPAARQAVEKWLRRALITQTQSLSLDWGPAWVELPNPPLQSVTSIVVRALDNTTTTANPATYFVRPNERLVGLNPAAIWPTHITPAGWTCTYVCGYGPDPEDVPEMIRLAIWNVAAGMYDNRGSAAMLVGLQQDVLRPYRIEGLPFKFAKGLEPPELLA